MDYAIETVKLEAVRGLAMRRTVPMEGLPDFFDEAFTDVAAAAGPAIAGAPFAQYYSVDPAAVDVEVVFPIAGPVTPPANMRVLELPAGEAAQVLHTGPYDAMEPVYVAIEAWMAEKGRAAVGPPREIYLTSPAESVPPEQYQTLVVQPLA
ncbi:MAG: GyrI-like domain-containing protein [Dehalococcoidia bacterium]